MIEKLVAGYFQQSIKNHVSKEDAINDSVIGMRVFDSPIVEYADASDPIFESFRSDLSITTGRFIPPKEWLKEAKTVISIFLPYSQEVKVGNSRDMKRPSAEWLHGRYEGQMLIDDLSRYLQKFLIEKNYACVVPSIDARYDAIIGTQISKEILDNTDYGSNWSERHVAYAAGLGTFGLSKGLITRKGIAGRFTSLITDYMHKPTVRAYTGIYDYCTFCGVCISNCPPKAITLQGGKEHTPCSRFIDWTFEQYNPRYACGKCQVKVPCMDGIPDRV